MDRQVADASMLDCLNADLYGLSLSECDAIRLQKEFLSKWRHVLRPSDVVRVEEKISDEENHLIDYIAVKYGSAGWLPIGDVNTPFTGNFNGNGWKITGLRNQATMDCISLFGNISGGTINNLDADCEGSSTGITQVELLDATPKAYYTILGRQLQKAPEKGVYIVLYDNGKAQKVVK